MLLSEGCCISQKKAIGLLITNPIFAEVLMACHQFCFAKIEKALFFDILRIKELSNMPSLTMPYAEKQT